MTSLSYKGGLILAGALIVLADADPARQGQSGITVSEDPQALADARKAASERDQGDPSFDLYRMPYLDQEELQALVNGSADLQSMLQKAVGSDQFEERLLGALLLARIGDEQGARTFAGLLEDSRVHPAQLWMLGRRDHGLLKPDTGLTPWLSAKLGDDDPQVRQKAAEVVGRLGSNQHSAELMQLAKDAKTDHRGRAAFWTCRLAPAADSLAMLKTRLAGSNERNWRWLMEALAPFPGAADPVVRNEAAVLAAMHLTALPDGYHGTGVMGALAALEGLDSATAPTVLRELAVTVPNTTIRGKILQLLAKRDETMAREVCVGVLESQQPCGFVVEAVGEIFARTADAAVVRLLVDRCTNPLNQCQDGQLALALLSIGGSEAEVALQNMFPRIDPWTRSYVQEKLAGMSPERIEERLVDLGIITMPAKNATSSALDAEEEMLTCQWLRILRAAGIVVEFDAETSEIPVRHDRLILAFSKASGGRFQPEAVLENCTLDSDGLVSGPYKVQFIHRNRLYSFEAEDFGDWYDVTSVVNALNRALEDAGISQRFISLEPDGQYAFFVFAEPVALAKAASEFHLPLGLDLDRARELGVEFEKEVVRQLMDEAR